ncbi:MAG: tetratricopeptide repeat protein [Terrimicrobiaceae bacterium]|nr:tetratricopeptide repeat protein [Terrimicrobiaceae bacterium]
MRTIWLIAGASLVASAAPAQNTPEEPEVRRAIPVNPAPLDDYENPTWMQRIPRAEPVRPLATPVIPEATPIPVAPAVPASTPLEVPYRPVPRPSPENMPPPTPPPAPVEDEAGTIRVAPTTPEETAKRTLALANSLYARKMHDLAIPEYERYLVSGVQESRDAALFRLAECHRILGNPAAARARYEDLVMEFREGEFAGAGAYRLGELLFAEGVYDAARIQFRTAADQAKDAEVRLTARYFLARSLDYLKRDQEAATAYREVVEADGKNPYRDHARMALANLEIRAGRKAEARKFFEAIAKSDSQLSDEAAVKAAALASEAGDREAALALFDRVLSSDRSDDWKPLAAIGAMRLRFQGGDYRGVIKLGEKAVDLAVPDARPEALQLLAASHRQTGNNLEARRVYDRLLKEFPDAAPAEDARLQRLVSLYALNDENLVAEVDAFLEKSTDPKARTQAQLLKAETLYKRQDYAGAGALYQKLLEGEIDPSLRADTLYKLGWCLAASGNPTGAAGVYSEFLEKYPSHAMAASALARRGLAHQESKAFDSALADFAAVSEKHPGTTEQELALLQTALIRGQQQKFPEMAAAFETLLEKFPKTAAAAQAHFWLGRTAFEQKQYKEAIPDLDKARKQDAAQYGERATLLIILAHYYLEDRDAVLAEAEKSKSTNLPAEVSVWLADRLARDGNHARVESLLAPLLANPAALPPAALIQLAEARIRLGKAGEAQGVVDRYLESARDPVSRARGVLASSRIAVARKDFPKALSLVEEALLLQPEGPLNAEARMLSGEILMARADFDGAARAFMTVSVLTDDPDITPRALQKAADAYRRADNPFEADRAMAELKQRFPDFQKSAKSKKDNT